MGLTHAQCWAHARRKVFEAQDIEPGPAGQALEAIGALYTVEAAIREQALTGQAKRAYRLAHAKPVAGRFFAWIDKQFAALGFLPSSPSSRRWPTFASGGRDSKSIWTIRMYRLTPTIWNAPCG